ncbi:MAG: hypothetical protein NZO16_04820 [Deltaproteobacteria bacterium]|nr:hypothetical protein [Deltaproteobacteria bacterium]
MNIIRKVLLCIIVSSFSFEFIFRFCWFNGYRFFPTFIDVDPVSEELIIKISDPVTTNFLLPQHYDLTDLKVRTKSLALNDSLTRQQILEFLTRSFDVKINPNLSWKLSYLISGLGALLICGWQTFLIIEILLAIWIFAFIGYANFLYPVYFKILVQTICLSSKFFGKLLNSENNFFLSKLMSPLLIIGCLLVTVLSVWHRTQLINRATKYFYHPDEGKMLTQTHFYLQHSLSSKAVSQQTVFKHPPMSAKFLAFVTKKFFNTRHQNSVTKYRYIQLYVSLVTCFLISLACLLVAGPLGLFLGISVSTSSTLISLSGLYIKEDILLALFTSLFVLGILFFLKKSNICYLIVSSIALILSITVKYSGLLNFLILVVTFPLYAKERCKKVLFGIFCGFIAGILLVFLLLPEFFLYSKKTLGGFFYELKRGLSGHHGFKVSWWDYLGLFMPYNVFFDYENFIFGFLTIPAVVLAWVKRHNSQSLFLLIGFVLNVLAFELSSGKPHPQYHRYLLPSYIFLIPLIAASLKTLFCYRPLSTIILLGFFFQGNIANLIELSDLKLATEGKYQASRANFLNSCKSPNRICRIYGKFIPKDVNQQHDENRLLVLRYVINDMALNRYLQSKLDLRRLIELNKIHLILLHGNLTKTISARRGFKPFLNPSYYIFAFKEPQQVLKKIDVFSKLEKYSRKR